MDIYIGGVRDRNAALHGDVVVVEIKPIDQWKVRLLFRIWKKNIAHCHRLQKCYAGHFVIMDMFSV